MVHRPKDPIRDLTSKMAVSVIDSRIFRDTFGTQSIRDVFSDAAYLDRLIEVEAALARAQSKVGIIPPQAGPAITNALKDIKLEYAY